jgi:hypothetical protein
MWISLWTVKGTTAVNGLKTLKVSVDHRNGPKILSPSTGCLKPAEPTVHEQGLTADPRRETGLSTVSTAVINTTNPKKLKSLKQQSRSRTSNPPADGPDTGRRLSRHQWRGWGMPVVPAKLSAALPSLGLFAVGHARTMQVPGLGGNGPVGSSRVPVQKMAAAMKGGTLP